VDLERARYLCSAEGLATLEQVPVEIAALDPVARSRALRRSLAPAEAAAVSEQLELRRRAAERFERPPRLMTAEGLDMATHPLVAERRAARLALGVPLTVDLTCGIGSDLAAIAVHGRVVGVDRDPIHARLASINVPSAAVLVGDAARPPVGLAGTAVMVDPSRRAGALRRFDPRGFSPRWDVAIEAARSGDRGAVKGPPGIDYAHIPPDAEVEFVQVGRDLREATLWLGEGAVAGLRRAVWLPGGETIDTHLPEARSDTRDAGPFILDPESCVTRAGLVRHLAARVGGWMLDGQVAYLGASEPSASRLAASFEVLDVAPFSLVRLRERLRERQWRPDEIRRRAFPIEPDDLRRQLGRLEGEPVTLLCTTIAQRRTVIVGRRVRLSQESTTAPPWEVAAR
jgi:hypothetical protein